MNSLHLQGCRQKKKNRILPGKQFNKVTPWAAVLGTGRKLQYELTWAPAQWRRAYYPHRKPQGDSLPFLWRSLADCVVPYSLEGSQFPTWGLSGELRCASVISIICQKWQVVSKCIVLPVERLDEATKSTTTLWQRYTRTPFPGIDFGTCPAQSPVHFQSNYKQSSRKVNQFIHSHLDCDKSASVA